ERSAEAGKLAREVVDAVGAAAGVPELRAPSAQVVAAEAGTVVEPRHVHVLAADPAIVLPGLAVEIGEEALHVDPDLLAEVAPDHVGAVADAVGMALRLRVQENAGGVDAARPEHHHLAQHLPLLPGLPIEVLDPPGEAALVDQDAGGHRVGADLELARLHRERKQVVGGAEEGGRVASASTLAAVV